MNKSILVPSPIYSISKKVLFYFSNYQKPDYLLTSILSFFIDMVY
jgi:hypothetical protein